MRGLLLRTLSGASTGADAAPSLRMKRFLVAGVMALVGTCIGLVIAETLIRTLHLTRDTSPLLFYPDDEFGYGYQPNQMARSLFGIELRTNQLGLRDRDYAEYPPALRKRIVLLGDSVTMGYGVRQAKVVSEILEALLNEQNRGPHEVINAGVEGFNTINEAAFYKKVARRYRPSEVWLIFLANDLRDSPSRVSHISPEGIPTDNVNSAIPLRLRWLLRKTGVYVLAVDVYERVAFLMSKERARAGAEPDKRVAATLRALSDLLAGVRDDGAMLKIAYFPSKREATGSGDDKESQLAVNVVEQFCVDNQIRFVDLREAFQREVKQGRDLYLPRDPIHPNEEGNAVMLSSLKEFMLDETQ